MKNCYNILCRLCMFTAVLLASFYHAVAQQPQCQQMEAVISSTSPASAPATPDIIKICKGESVSFQGHVTFQVSGQGAHYLWTVSDGTSDTSTSLAFTHVFNEEGVFTVDFSAEDSAGCLACGTRKVIYVSTTPVFEGTSAPDIVCIFRDNQLNGMVTPVPGGFNCAPPVSGVTFLPDGSGVSYTTSILVKCFQPCDTITDGTDISSICLTMEHSYLGDLDWKITCPDGKTAQMKQFGFGTNTYLGEPNDIGCATTADNTPGVGWEYCFSDLATWGTMQQELAAGNTVGGVGCPSGNSMSPGLYKPIESFDSLIGCHLNGNWTITVTDHLLSDNGYIFNWGIDFNKNVPDYSFTPNYVQKWWTGPFITQAIGDNIIIHPDSAGDFCYQFHVMDDINNCVHDTTICIHVDTLPIYEVTDTVCYGQSKFGYFNAGDYYDTFEAANTCDSVRLLHLYANPYFNVDLGPDTAFCQFDTIKLEPVVLPVSSGYQYKWTPQAGLLLPDTAGNNYFIMDSTVTYEVVVTTPLGCTDTDRITIQSYPGNFSLLVSTSDTGICPGDSVQIQVIGQGNKFQWIPEEGLSNPYIPNPIASPEQETWYTLYVTSVNGCMDTQYVHIAPYPAASISLPDSADLYPGESYMMNPVTNASEFSWYPPYALSSTTTSNPYANPEKDTKYYVTARTDMGCEANDSINIRVKETVTNFPNAFSPAIEGTLKPVIRGLATLKYFRIFNRWGNLIFESQDINMGWDGTYKGTQQPTGVYVYEIEGTTDNGSIFHHTGNVTLLR